jgi:hypothetical protein
MTYAQRAGMPDRVWVGRDAIGGLLVYPKLPDHRQAAEYMRALTRPEVEKLAPEGIDVQQYLNSLLRTIEGQRKHIARLQEQIRDAEGDKRDAAAEARWSERQGDDYGSF